MRPVQLWHLVLGLKWHTTQGFVIARIDRDVHPVGATV